MTEEKAIECIRSDLKSIGVIPLQRHWENRVFPVIGKYVTENVANLTQYVNRHRFMLNHKVLEMLYNEISQHRFNTYKVTQLIDLVFRNFLAINAQMVKDIENDQWVPEEAGEELLRMDFSTKPILL